MTIDSAMSVLTQVPGSSRGRPEPLSDTQKNQLGEIVGKYDLENMSDEDRADMRLELREAGFTRSPELRAELESLGVDFSAAAGRGGKGMPEELSLSASTSLDSVTLQLLQDIIAEYDVATLTDEDRKELREQLKEAGFERSPATRSALQELGVLDVPFAVDERI